MKSPDSAIEQLLWSQDGPRNKILHIDDKGTYFERPIPNGIPEDILKIFDGRLRSIRRTSGGISLCEPHQLVLCERTGTPLIRVRVRIPDLNRTRDGSLIDTSVVLRSKIVSPSELQSPFVFRKEPLSVSFIDAGNGIIPVSVFHIEDSTEEPLAYFTETNQLYQIHLKESGDMVSLFVYAVPARTLRSPNPDNTIELARAQENLSLLKIAGKEILPQCLKLKGEYLVPTGKSYDYLRSCLTAMLDPKTKKELEPILMNVARKEDDLLPFGVFEPL